MSTTDDNKAIVRRVLDEVWNGQRLDRLDELVVQDYVDHAALLGQAPGLAGAKQTWATYIAAFADTRIWFEDLVAEDDKVAVRYSGAGTHQGELQAIPATGKGIRASSISIFRLSDGKIVDKWEQWDRLGLLQQLGAIPGMAHEARSSPEPGAPEAGRASREPSMSTEENKAVVRRFHEEVFNERKVDRADELFTEDYVDHGALPGQAPGLAGAKRKWAGYIDGIDGSIWTEDLLAEGDRVAARWTVEGTHRGDLLGIAATGRRFRLGGISIYLVADGKIAEQWEQLDRLGLLQQLGAMPGPAAPVATPA